MTATKPKQRLKYVLDFDALSNGRLGSATIRALEEATGRLVFSDSLKVESAKEREKSAGRFVEALGLRGVRRVAEFRKAFEEKCLGLVSQRRAHEQEQAKEGQRHAGGEKRERTSQADLLIALAAAAELFHTPGNGGDGEAFATFSINGHRETWPIRSRGFRSWLAQLHFAQTKKAPNTQALQEATDVLAGQALFGGPEYPVAVRLAEHQGAIYLDLVDPDWRAIEITATGWRVIPNPPVRFARRRGMLALPEPVEGGSVEELRPLVNLTDKDSWILAVSFLVAALRPDRPFPVLAVNGEQGSAKSTLCRILRALIDPNAAPLRRPPRDDRDLMIAAQNGWLVALDNLSGIAAPLSDVLCTLATGGGFGTRELYTDDEEKLFNSTRPIMLNGIEDVATRPDLVDRSLLLTLPEIVEEYRRDEDSLWKEFKAIRPRVLGALLTAVSMALRNLPTIKLASKPRMADFALWIVAAEPALTWTPGDFLAAYTRNRQGANEAALESSLIGGLILSLVSNVAFEGTSRELLNALESYADEKLKKHRDWPNGPRKLSGELRRLAPVLRRLRVSVAFFRGQDAQRARLIRIESTRKRPSTPSRPSGDPENAGDFSGRSSDGPGGPTVQDSPGINTGFFVDSDDPDGLDGHSQTDSGSGQEEPEGDGHGDAWEGD
jgi:hypothetical protein